MKIHAPKAFYDLRNQEFIDIESSLNLKKNKNFIEKASEVGQGGKSGAFFLTTFDYSLLIKTINKNELKLMKKILKDYSKHFRNNKKSFLAKIYGIYRF